MHAQIYSGSSLIFVLSLIIYKKEYNFRQF